MRVQDDGPAWVKIDGAKAIGETDKALRVEVDGERYWVPKSCIHDDSETHKMGTDGNLIIAGWTDAAKEMDGEEYEP